MVSGESGGDWQAIQIQFPPSLVALKWQSILWVYVSMFIHLHIIEYMHAYYIYTHGGNMKCGCYGGNGNVGKF